MSIKNAIKRREQNDSRNIDARAYVTERRRKRDGDRFGLETLESDLVSLNETVNRATSEWQTQETMLNTRASIEAMQSRLGLYQDWQKKYGGADLSELANGYQSILDGWDNRSSVYGYYQNADAYNTARKNAQLGKQFSGLTYDDVQKKLKEYEVGSDEYNYLSKYTGYTDLRDFDKAIEAQKNSKREKAPSSVQKNPNFVSNQKKYAVNPLMEQAVSNTMTSAVDEDYVKELEKAKNIHALDNAFDEYKDLMNAEDFAEKSQYQNTAKRDGLWEKLGFSGEDETYEFINDVDGARERLIAKYKEGNGATELESHGYEYMTEDEKAVFNYLHNTDPKAADKYLQDMEVSLNKRLYGETTGKWEEWSDSGALASIGLSAATPILNIAGGIGSAVEGVRELAQGKEYNPYAPLRMASNATSDIREYVGENIAEKTNGMEILGQNIPQFLYQTGMSVADTAVGSQMFGKAFVAVMGMSSATQRAKELKEAGASSEEIAMGAVASGAFEMAFEKIPLDNLLKAKGVDSVKKIFTEALKQAGLEGFEEFGTEVANIVFDKISRGKDSDAYKNYEEYIARGYSPEEAERLAKQDLNKQIGWAFAGGVLSGVSMGIVDSTAQYFDNKGVGKQIRSNDRIQEMLDITSQMTPEESEAYKAYDAYVKSGIGAENISNAQLGNLYNTTVREADSTYRSRKTTAEQKANAVETMKKIGVVDTSKPEAERKRQQRVEELNKGEVTEVTATGNSTKIDGIRIEDGSTIVLTSQGEHKAEDMTSSSNDAEILSYAENMGAEKGNLFIKNYDGKQNVDAYFKSFDMAYTYGEDGIGSDYALKNKGVLTEAQVADIYKNAMNIKSNARQKAIDDITAKYSAKTIKKGTFDDSIIDYNSKNTDGTKVNWNTLTSKQREAIRFAKAFSKATGVNIVFTKSKIENGKHKGENGSYNPKKNTITLDVYAGRMDANTAVDAIIPTLSHEVTHWMKAKAPEMYSKLQEKVMNTLNLDEEMSLDDRIKIKKWEMETNHKDQKATDEDAIDELVARACEDMLSNSETARELLSALSEKEQKSFMAKVEEIFNNLLEWVNNLLAQYKSESDEAMVLRKYEEKLKEAQKLWDEAFAEAVKANQALNKAGTTAEKELKLAERKTVQHSDRDSEGNTLTPEQQEFFKDSKVRDENGNLKVMYHGTTASFTTFDKKKARSSGYYGSGFYFTDSNSHAKQYGNQYKVYLNITNPMREGSNNITKAQLKKFVQEVANHDDYGIENYGYDATVSSVVNNLYGKDDFAIITDINATCIGDMVEAIMLFNEVNGTTYDGIIVPTETVAFYPNQIKSVDNTNPTSDPDIRYSDRVHEYDQAEDNDLAEFVGSVVVGNAREKDYRVISKHISDRLAIEIQKIVGLNVSGYGNEIDKGQVEHILKEHGEHGRSDNSMADVGDIARIGYAIENFDKIREGNNRSKYKNSDGTKAKTVELQTRIGNNFYYVVEAVPDAKVKKLKVVSAYINKKDTFSEVAVSNDPSRYVQDESQSYVFNNIISDSNKKSTTPEQFSDRDFDYVDSRTLLANALETVAQTDSEKELLTEYRKYIDILGIKESELSEIKAEIKELSFAKGKRDTQRLEYLQRRAEKLQNSINWYDKKLLNMEAAAPLKAVVDRERAKARKKAYEKNREYTKQTMTSYKENVEKKAKIESITQKALVLNKWMLKNSKDEHIPEAMKPVVAHLLKAIDFSSKQLLGMRGGQYNGMPTQKDISIARALRDVQQMMSDAKVDGEVLYELYGADLDEDMKALVKSVDLYASVVGDNAYVLNQMTLDDLHKFDKIVGAIKSSVTKMNQFHVVNHKKGIMHLGQQTINDMEELGQAKLHKNKFAQSVSQMMNWGNTTPYYAFKRFGEGGVKVYEALMEGWDKFAFHIKKIIDYSEATYTSDDVKNWSKEVKTFKGIDGDIQMTIPQIMSLYCLQKRDQAMGHILRGGIRVSDIETKGGVISQADGSVISKSLLESIIGSLTDEQIRVADALQKFMNEDCAEWGNEISMKRFGYKAFGEPNYFPIRSDENVTGEDTPKEEQKSLYRLLNMSFTKALTENANNRIIVDNIFDVFAQHTSEMAKYNALALPVLDAVRWFNYKEKGEQTDGRYKTYTVKQAMEKALGKDAKNYVTTFLKDINGADNVGRDRLAKGFMSNAKIASVGFNAKVVALQPTSYLRASAVIDNKYLVQAFSKKPKIAMAEKWCGMAQWKSLGFIDINVQRGVADLIKHDESFKDKATEWSMKGAEVADKVTIGYLWNACEAEVKATRSDLTVGTDEYYTAVGKRLREVIYATQVVDSTMTRSHMMRSGDNWDKMLTNFASEPTLSYNMLMDVYYDYNLSKRKGESIAFNKHGKKLARTLYAYTITNAITALLELGFEAFRDDEEKDPEELMKMYLENLYLNTSIINKIPYAKEAISLLQGFSSSRIDTQWMQYFAYTAKGIVKLLSGEGNAYTTAKNGIKAFSYLSGMPFFNLWRDANALLDKTDILTAEELEEMYNDTIGSIFPTLKIK